LEPAPNAECVNIFIVLPIIPVWASLLVTTIKNTAKDTRKIPVNSLIKILLPAVLVLVLFLPVLIFLLVVLEFLFVFFADVLAIKKTSP
jgi:hypothetical protein